MMTALKRLLRREAAPAASCVSAAVARPLMVPLLEGEISYTQTRVAESASGDLRNARIVAHDPSSPLADVYKLLRTQVLQRLTCNGWNSIGITAPSRGCGCTVTAVNLAISLAQDVNHTVLLVDLDLRKPSIHQLLGSHGKGLSDYLTDGSVADILFNPGIERLVVFPGRVPVLNSSELLRTARMIDLIRELKARYESRIVIFDLPPVLSSDDVLVVAPHLDALLLVAEEGATSEQELKQALAMLKGGKLLGTVLNKAKGSESHRPVREPRTLSRG